MLRVFVTGDNHFGKKYNRYPEIREELIQSRFDVLQKMVQKAEQEKCGLFAVTGDLFDNISSIKVGDVKQIAAILSSFDGTVLVLPGNHDYYTGDEKVWKDFENAAAAADNLILLKEFRTYSFEIGEEQVTVYPAYCQSKHAGKNNLEWIKEAEIAKEGCINLGIAHGAIKGVTPDIKEEYFLMTESELTGIPVDAWLIGHTHIAYPDLPLEKEISGYKIFNAGTHEQLDLHNNTEGSAFILSIEKTGAVARVTAKRIACGSIRFYDLSVNVSADHENALENALCGLFDGLGDRSIVRVTIKGVVKPGEYREKEELYKRLCSRFMSYEIVDAELSEEISIEKIRSEFAETSFAAQFMEQLIDKPTELQLAYQLLQECREN